ncbi:glyoxylate/hydroxypyruvate reductase HPR3-like [Mangifera indica]|uniref:glyoxylate/hydroxypyruvate reductase HPR3-like n=1 Tax=Mangifera indica TaxID=29780 RepID=UPI001CFACCBD|nr:glyoxylate/hydroxypyruvate reductase HPR3-like [Mangifera indica]
MATDEHLPRVLLIRKPKVFTLFGEESFTSKKFQFLKAYDSTLPLHQFLTTDADAKSVQAIFSTAPVTADILQLLPMVRLVVATSAGLNHIDLAECRRLGVAVANSGTVFSEDVADVAVGLLIDVFRKMSAASRYVRQGLWLAKGDYPLGSKLGGKRVGIVGLGSIGHEVAKRLEAFGCRISYNSRKEKPGVEYSFYSDVSELAGNSDALIICCALTHQTHHMINKQVLLALGKNGVIINVGRGGIIDEKEMVECLMKGEIGGAGLDVFENEPHVPKQLFELDNVVLSPHCAVATPDSLKNVCELAVKNLEAFFSNEPLLSPVTNDD